MIHPLVPKDDESNKNDVVSGQKKYFPPVQECIVCNDPVSSFMVDPLGDRLVVGTNRGTIEIWDVSQQRSTTTTTFCGDENRIEQGEIRRKGAIQLEFIDMTNELRLIEKTHSLDDQAQSAVEEVERVSASLLVYASREEEDENDEENSQTSQYMSDDNNYDVNNNRSNTRKSHDSNLADERCDGLSDMLCTHQITSEEEILMDIDSIVSQTRDDSHILSTNNEETLLSSTREGNNTIPPSANEASDNSLSLPQCKPHRKFSSIEIPNHLPIEKAGFVGVQHHHTEGTTLSLWQMSQEENRFKLTSLINLPLSPQPTPQVSYDGNRIIVFGQDHIGLIILVYKVTR